MLLYKKLEQEEKHRLGVTLQKLNFSHLPVISTYLVGKNVFNLSPVEDVKMDFLYQ